MQEQGWKDQVVNSCGLAVVTGHVFRENKMFLVRSKVGINVLCSSKLKSSIGN